MEELKRLPKGYRPQLMRAKKRIKELLFAISNLKNVGGYRQSLDTKLSSLAMHLSIISRTNTADEISLKVKWGVITTTVTVDIKTEKFKLGSMCDVQIPNTDKYIQNCKW